MRDISFDGGGGEEFQKKIMGWGCPGGFRGFANSLNGGSGAVAPGAIILQKF